MQKKRCDRCDEEWEESFFCTKHSNKFYTDMEEVPDIRWSGDSRTSGYIFEDVEHHTGNVCFNCCNCNLK